MVVVVFFVVPAVLIIDGICAAFSRASHLYFLIVSSSKMGVAQNASDNDDGTLEIGMGMCLIGLRGMLIFYCIMIPFGCVYT